MTELIRAVVAVDVGGTVIKSALFDESMQELWRSDRPTPVADGVPRVVRAIDEVIGSATQALGSRADVVAAGVVCPGHVDAGTGMANYSANIGWHDLPLRDELTRTTGLPVSIDHDVRAAGRAEAVLGAARGVRHALYLPIGTGIAGAVISDGSVLTGASGLAGEIGHVPVIPDGERCACGQNGCLETYASAASIARRYRAAGGGEAAVTAEQVIARATAAEPPAVTVFEDALRALALALVGYTLLLDPELIVIGGGLSGAGAQLLDPLVARMSDGLAWRDAPGWRLVGSVAMLAGSARR